MDNSHSAPVAPRTRQRTARRRLVGMGAILVAVVTFGVAAAVGSADRSTEGGRWHPQQASLGSEGQVDNASASLSRNPISYRPETGALTASNAITAGGSGKATFVLGPRHFGVAYVPEFVGTSGGDLPAIESSPLVLGVRQLDGVVFVPEFLGASGGDLPSVESSPLVLGPRHIEGVAFVPAYVGHADGVFPENTR